MKKQHDPPASDPRKHGPQPPYPAETQPHPGSEQAMRPKPDFGEDSYRGHGRLKDRVAVITGGDSGIGRAVALAFAREGADIAIGYLSEHEDAKQIAKIVEDAGRRCHLLPGDLADPDVCHNLVNETFEAFGRLDVLVNNAAYQGKSLDRFEDLDVERVERAFRTNVIAMFHTTKAALPHMKAGGSVINTTSIQAFDPSPKLIDYATTKGAIVTFTEGLSKELAERGIRVNAVAPGPIWTPLIPQSFDAEEVENFGTDVPLGRPGQPIEVAHAFVFLASDAASYITGHVLAVTGGRLL